MENHKTENLHELYDFINLYGNGEEGLYKEGTTNLENNELGSSSNQYQ